jgi:hypothetical protein
LRVHVDQAVAQPGLRAGQAGQFAPPHAGVRGGDHQDLIGSAADPIHDGVDLSSGGGGSLGRSGGW